MTLTNPNPPLADEWLARLAGLAAGTEDWWDIIRQAEDAAANISGGQIQGERGLVTETTVELADGSVLRWREAREGESVYYEVRAGDASHSWTYASEADIEALPGSDDLDDYEDCQAQDREKLAREWNDAC